MLLAVKYLDGTEVEVVRTATALRAVEKANKLPLQVLMTQGSWWADELAYHVLKQKHVEERSFDDWLDSVETILWDRPVAEILAVAQAFGYRISDDRPADGADPTGGAEAEASRADSSTPL
jgi:hypothetical protein